MNLVREGLQGGGPNAYNLAEVSPCGDQVHHKIAEICRSENSFDPLSLKREPQYSRGHTLAVMTAAFLLTMMFANVSSFSVPVQELFPS